MNQVIEEIARGVSPEKARVFISWFRQRKRTGSLPIELAQDPDTDFLDVELHGDRLVSVRTDVAPSRAPDRTETIVLAHGQKEEDESPVAFSAGNYYLKTALAARHRTEVSLASGESKRRDARGLLPAPAAAPTGTTSYQDLFKRSNSREIGPNDPAFQDSERHRKILAFQKLHPGLTYSEAMARMAREKLL